MSHFQTCAKATFNRIIISSNADTALNYLLTLLENDTDDETTAPAERQTMDQRWHNVKDALSGIICIV
jgi:hypothetical protein